MSSKSKMEKNPATGLMTVDRKGVKWNHEYKARRIARKTARWTRILDPNQKGVNTLAGERA